MMPAFFEVQATLQAWSNWPPLAFVRDSKYGMPGVQSVHLMGLTVLLATILALNLRLLGAGSLSLKLLDRQLKPWTTGALAIVVLSGIAIFLANPQKYLGSNPFRVKMALLFLAIVFHFAVLRRVLYSEPRARPRYVHVTIAAVSLTLWFGVGWAGRAIAFIP
jgi:hypothetical protein